MKAPAELGKTLLRLLLVLATGLFCESLTKAQSSQIGPLATEPPPGNAALFFGANQFDEKRVTELSFAVNDAIAQAYLFVLQLRLIPPRNCTLMVSGEATSEALSTQLRSLTNAGVRLEKGNRTKLLTELDRIKGIASGSEDLLLISIATHGFEDKGGQNAYILPADGALSLPDDCALNIRKMEGSIENSLAGKKLLIIDACRKRIQNNGRAPDSGLTEAFWNALATAKGQALLSSCDRKQISLEDTNLAHGVFTYFLIEGLQGGAPGNLEGHVTLGSLVGFVRTNVTAWVRKTHPDFTDEEIQNPKFEGPPSAFDIPLASDAQGTERTKQFRREISAVIEALKSKIQIKGDRGSFTFELFDKLVNELKGAAPDTAGQSLLSQCKDFAAGNLKDEVFVAYLEKTLGVALPMDRALKIQGDQTLALLRTRVGISGLTLQIWEAVERKFHVILAGLQRQGFPEYGVEYFKKEMRQLREFADDPTSQPQLISGILAMEQKDKSKCQNQLNEVMTAAQAYAHVHNNRLPPDFTSLSNKLDDTAVLVCPADSQHPPASDWSALRKTNVSYEYVFPSALQTKLTSNHIVFRCPIHGSVVMGDGSVLAAAPTNSIEHQDETLWRIEHEADLEKASH